MLDAGSFRQPVEFECLLKILGNRLLAIDVFACGDGLAYRINPLSGCLRIKIDGVIRFCEGFIEVGGVRQASQLPRNGLELGSIPSNQ